jgi:hypothetical protein
MIKGEYIFYENGKEICRSKNLITTYGKRYITSLLAGLNSSTGKDMSFGIGNTAATESDNRLEFEFYRIPVSLGSIDINTMEDPTTYTAIYKTTIPADVSGIISEIGLYPSTRSSINNFDSRFISDFEINTDWQSTFETATYAENVTPKIGENLLEFKFDGADITGLTSEYLYGIGKFDLSGYSAKDSLSVAFQVPDTNITSIKIKFYSDANSYYYADITGLEQGEYISNISLSDILSSIEGTPLGSAISYIAIELTRISAAEPASVYMDGLRINDEDTFDPNFGLISRSVLNIPINKVAGRSLDVEYKLSLDF